MTDLCDRVEVFKSLSSFCRSNGRTQDFSHQAPWLDDCSSVMCKTKVLACNLASASTWCVRRSMLYRYTYYAVNMYNEVRERRVKRKGVCGGGGVTKGTVEEVEEEGRQTILAKDRRYSNAIVAAAAACTAKHFCRLPWLQDNHHFFPPSQARKYPVPFCINPPSSCTPLPSFSFRCCCRCHHCRRLLEHRSPREPTFARKKGRSTAVYHRGLLLIVIKYSSTVTRSKFS